MWTTKVGLRLAEPLGSPPVLGRLKPQEAANAVWSIATLRFDLADAARVARPVARAADAAVWQAWKPQELAHAGASLAWYGFLAPTRAWAAAINQAINQ